MNEPMNEAASLIKSAQSVLADQTKQISELHESMSRQQALIDSLMPVAIWGPGTPEPSPEPEG